MSDQATRTWTDAEKEAWIEQHLPEDGPDSPPTHVVTWQPTWRFSVLVPPWCDPEQVQTQLVEVLNDLELDYDVAERMGRTFEAYVLDAENEGSTSSLKEILH